MDTSTAIIQAVGTTTGQLMTDSVPIFLWLAGLFIALFGFGLLWRSITRSARKILR